MRICVKLKNVPEDTLLNRNSICEDSIRFCTEKKYTEDIPLDKEDAVK